LRLKEIEITVRVLSARISVVIHYFTRKLSLAFFGIENASNSWNWFLFKQIANRFDRVALLETFSALRKRLFHLLNPFLFSSATDLKEFHFGCHCPRCFHS